MANINDVKTDKQLGRNTKEALMFDMAAIITKAEEQGYVLLPNDTFALGYMAGKYGLDRITPENQEAVLAAVAEYDKTDDLALFDTVGEVLIDLEVIQNKDGLI